METVDDKIKENIVHFHDYSLSTLNFSKNGILLYVCETKRASREPCRNSCELKKNEKVIFIRANVFSLYNAILCAERHSCSFRMWKAVG